MSCEACEEAQTSDRAMDMYPYRWSFATVLVIGCKEHIRQIFEALNAAQEAEE